MASAVSLKSNLKTGMSKVKFSSPKTIPRIEKTKNGTANLGKGVANDKSLKKVFIKRNYYTKLVI